MVQSTGFRVGIISEPEQTTRFTDDQVTRDIPCSGMSLGYSNKKFNRTNEYHNGFS